MSAVNDDDPWRPRVHFTAARHWINDPNGLIHHDGEYHLFHQYNPHGDQWGHMSWGHAVSTDMLHWRELPVAIPETEDRMAYSGSCVVDHARTSGLGEAPAAPMVAIYTGAPTLASLAAPRGGWSALGTARRRTGGSLHADRIQDQRLAWSTDRGRTWTLVRDSVLDVGSTGFRDPKVFFHEPTQRWVMLVSHADEGRLAFYASHDLHRWTHLSDWTLDIAGGKVWECPDLMQLPIDREDAGTGATAWVIKVDVFEGHPAGGSGALVVVGDFDGTRFTSTQAAQWVDGGRDFYAAIAFAAMPPVRASAVPKAGQPPRGAASEASVGAPDNTRCVWLGWMNDHRYAKDTPTSPWRGAMTIPRELRLVRQGLELVLCQRPIAELDALRGPPHTITGRRFGAAPHELFAPGVLPVAHEIDIDVDAPNATRWRLALRCGGDEATFVTIDRHAGTIGIDRRSSGVALPNGNFAAHDVTGWAGARAPSVRLRIAIDACSIEVFAGDGRVVLTSLVFPRPTSTGIRIDAEGDAEVRRMTVWPLTAAMRHTAPKPRRDNRAMNAPLRLGILGCANIARQFATHVAPSTAVRIVAAASRDTAKAAAFATEFGRPQAPMRHHGSYEALLDDDGIDAVYIPLPNNLHAPWAIAAVQRGKHVLCEKPLALGRAEAQSMFDAARQHGVFLLESYPWWFQPQTAALNRLLQEIGEVRTMQAAFTFTLGNPQTNIRMRAELGGGALLDAGSYPLSLVRLVMGEAPQRVQSTSTWAESGVDIATTATLHFSGGRTAQIACAMNTATVRQALICGTRGVIDTEFLNHTGGPTPTSPDGFQPSRLRVRRGTAATVAFEDVAAPTGSGFRFAAEAFAKVIAQRDDAAIERAAQASVDIAATLEALARSAREGAAVDL